MLIVTDTNTVLSGLLWHGPSRRLIDLARARSLMLCTSLVLLAELAEVIGRDKFAHRVHLAGLSAAELVQDYRRLAHIVEPQPLPAPVSRDPDSAQHLGGSIICGCMPKPSVSPGSGALDGKSESCADSYFAGYPMSHRVPY